MSNREKKEREHIRKLVAEYIEANGVPGTVAMKEYLLECGYSVGLGLVAQIYHELSYLAKRQPSYTWTWKEPE